MLFTLTVEESKTIVDFNKSKNIYESRSKELFVLGFKLFKQHKDSKASEVSKCLMAHVGMLQDKNTKARAKKIFKLAESYTRMKPISNFSMLHMYNLEGMIKLLEYIEANEDKCEIKLELAKQLIKDVFVKDIAKTEYNNKMGDVLLEIKVANKIVDKDGEYVIEDFDKKLLKVNDDVLIEMYEVMLAEIAKRDLLEDDVEEVA